MAVVNSICFILVFYEPGCSDSGVYNEASDSVLKLVSSLNNSFTSCDTTFCISTNCFSFEFRKITSDDLGQLVKIVWQHHRM